MIYLDSAATTFQKPPAVGRAMTEALASMSSPGRGGHPLAMRAADTAFRCRTELAELFGLDGPEGVAFTLNATHALNIAIKSLVPPGGRVVISGYEHNAVTRPLTALKAKVSVADGPLFDQEAAIRAFDELIAPGVDVVICNHVSNVFGFVQPVEKVAALCRSRGVPLIVDASQSAGILPITYAYIRLLGTEGLETVTKTAILNANYLAAKFKDTYGIVYTGATGRVGHELILECRTVKERSGIDEGDIAKRLMDFGYHAPTLSFPVHGTLMVEPTESESKAELDRFVEVMECIWNEIKEVEEGKASKEDNVLKNAPHPEYEVTADEWKHAYPRTKAAFPLEWLHDSKFWINVARVDNAYGDRNLIPTLCACEI